LEIDFNNGQKKETRIVRIEKEREKFSIELLIDSRTVELWWPNGFGRQPLYPIKLSVSSTIFCMSIRVLLILLIS
jgi:hypothetical protein